MSEVPLYLEGSGAVAPFVLRAVERAFVLRCAQHLPETLDFERKSDQNLSGDEVYRTNSLISLSKNMLCSELQRQTGFHSILFSYKIRHIPSV